MVNLLMRAILEKLGSNGLYTFYVSVFEPHFIRSFQIHSGPNFLCRYLALRLKKKQVFRIRCKIISKSQLFVESSSEIPQINNHLNCEFRFSSLHS